MWGQYRATLARHLDDDEYDALSMFMDTLPATRDVIAREPRAQPLPAHLLEELKTGRDSSVNSYRLLTGKRPDAKPRQLRRWSLKRLVDRISGRSGH
jgi:hypothetical protein